MQGAKPLGETGVLRAITDRPYDCILYFCGRCRLRRVIAPTVSHISPLPRTLGSQGAKPLAKKKLKSPGDGVWGFPPMRNLVQRSPLGGVCGAQSDELGFALGTRCAWRRLSAVLPQKEKGVCPIFGYGSIAPYEPRWESRRERPRGGVSGMM